MPLKQRLAQVPNTVWLAMAAAGVAGFLMPSTMTFGLSNSPLVGSVVAGVECMIVGYVVVTAQLSKQHWSIG